MSLLPRLERFALRRAGNRTDAKDLVQETCRRALEAQGRFAPGTDLGAWLFSILRNLHVDRCRRASREVLGAIELERLPASACEPDPMWTDFSQDDVIRATALLPRPYRDAYELYVVAGLSYDQISQRLGIPERTVGTRLHRARLRLRGILARQAAAYCEAA